MSIKRASKPRRVLETRRTACILRYINGLPGFMAVKRHQGGACRNGDPDVTGCVPGGRRLELEVKQPGEDPSKLQRIRLAEWAEAGALTGVVTDVNDTHALFCKWGLMRNGSESQ